MAFEGVEIGLPLGKCLVQEGSDRLDEVLAEVVRALTARVNGEVGEVFEGYLKDKDTYRSEVVRGIGRLIEEDLFIMEQPLKQIGFSSRTISRLPDLFEERHGGFQSVVQIYCGEGSPSDFQKRLADIGWRFVKVSHVACRPGTFEVVLPFDDVVFTGEFDESLGLNDILEEYPHVFNNRESVEYYMAKIFAETDGPVYYSSLCEEVKSRMGSDGVGKVHKSLSPRSFYAAMVRLEKALEYFRREIVRYPYFNGTRKKGGDALAVRKEGEEDDFNNPFDEGSWKHRFYEAMRNKGMYLGEVSSVYKLFLSIAEKLDENGKLDRGDISKIFGERGVKDVHTISRMLFEGTEYKLVARGVGTQGVRVLVVTR